MENETKDLKEELIARVWDKGLTYKGVNKDLYRKDAAGAWIYRPAYGDKTSMLGWEIDHVFPQSRGGGDDLENLRPMHWRNNESKSDDYPHYKAVITSDGTKNISKIINCTVSESLQVILKKLYKIDEND